MPAAATKVAAVRCRQYATTLQQHHSHAHSQQSHQIQVATTHSEHHVPRQLSPPVSPPGKFHGQKLERTENHPNPLRPTKPQGPKRAPPAPSAAFRYADFSALSVKGACGFRLNMKSFTWGDTAVQVSAHLVSDYLLSGFCLCTGIPSCRVICQDNSAMRICIGS